ncbi:hypothetical protein BS78_05G120500 [Paspalum vaginatum]|nr:hypothetical protein BS78_05G120500 [Paspalum vaginatum]
MAEAEPKLPLAPPTTFADLPEDFQYSILRRNPCKVDRVRIRRPRPRPDPAIQVLCGCRVHHYLDLIPGWARCFGSYDGCWVFLHLHYGPVRLHWLHNVRTGECDYLPSAVVHHYNGYYPVVHSVTILAAALSSSPADDESSSYDAVFIAASWLVPGTAAVDLPRRCVAFWRRGCLWAYRFEAPDVEDVAYRDRDCAFYLLLTSDDHILVCTPVQPPEGGFSIQIEERRFSPGGRTYDHIIRDRYLVMSREEVLLVVRFVPALHQPTSKFRVFQATIRQVPDADANADVFDDLLALYQQFPWEWSELDTLDGRMLFLGHGCSRSYETGDYPGCEDGIYFFDDGKFYEEEMIFGGPSNWSYPCRDNGRWSQGLVDLCFPAPGPSNQSPPAWVLP